MSQQHLPAATSHKLGKAYTATLCFPWASYGDRTDHTCKCLSVCLLTRFRANSLGDLRKSWQRKVLFTQRWAMAVWHTRYTLSWTNIQVPAFNVCGGQSTNPCHNTDALPKGAKAREIAQSVRCLRESDSPKSTKIPAEAAHICSPHLGRPRQRALDVVAS